MEWLKFSFDVAQTLLIAVIGIMNWLNNRQRITVGTISKLEDAIDERLDGLLERVTRVEQDAKNAPNHDDFKRVHQRLDILNGELKELKGEFSSMRGVLNMIHQHLMSSRP